MRIRAGLILALWGAILASAQSVQIPPLRGRVNDLAQLLDASAASALEAKLADYEKSTSNQFVLLTIPTLGGVPLEEYSLKVAEAWKLGAKGVDNGSLLFIAKEERKIRIEVGYGLEPTLTDAVTSSIIRNRIAPRFQEGDYQGGILAAFEAMMQAAEGKFESPALSGGEERRGLPWVLFGLMALAGYGFMGMITYFALFMRGGGSVMSYLFLLAGYGIGGSALSDRGSKLGYALFYVFLIAFPLARIIIGRTKSGRQRIEKFASRTFSSGGSSRGWRTVSSHSSFHSSSSSSHSSFSGGGGRFGGGGASGGW